MNHFASVHYYAVYCYQHMYICILYYSMCKMHVCQTFTSCVLTGSPDDVTDIKTTCGRVAQWSSVSSDPVCVVQFGIQ